MAGLLKLATMLHGGRAAPPNLHLRSLNHHIHEDVTSQNFAVNFLSEAGHLHIQHSSALSVSAFGFGGTNGHVVLKGSASAGTADKPKEKRVAFLFTGQGAQYVGMGKQLYDTEPVFRDAMDRCAKVLDELLSQPLLEVLYPKVPPSSPEEPSLLDQTQFSQPAIFALQYSLVEFWKSRGVKPCALLGHSVGEYCAAVVAGVMQLEDALRLIAARGRLIAEHCEAGVGSMLAVFASEAQCLKAIVDLGVQEEVSVAAVNGPKMVVVSGRAEAAAKVAAATGATTRPLKVSHAFHSPLMSPALGPFGEEARTLALGQPSALSAARFFSTVLGREAGDELADASYWCRHIPGTVRFSAAMEALDAEVQPDAYLEIGASPVLCNMAKRFLKRGTGPAPVWAGSLDPKAADDRAAVAAAAKATGARPPRPWAKFRRQPYPWREAGHPLIRKRTKRADGSVLYSTPIDGHVLELLSHHIVHGEVVVPGACYLEMIIACAFEHFGKDEAWFVEGLGFAKPLVLRLVEGKLEEPVELRVAIWPDGRVEVESEVGSDPEENIVAAHVDATLVRQPGSWQANSLEQDHFDLDALRASCPEVIDIDQMYSLGVDVGLPLMKRFRAVRQVNVNKSELKGLSRLEMERDGTHVGFLVGPSVLDSTFQSLMALADPAIGLGSLQIPLSIQRLQPTGRSLSIGVWSHFQLVEYTDHSKIFKAWMMNDKGEVLLHFNRVHLQEVRDEHIQRVLAASGRKDAEQEAMYSVEWRGAEEADASATNAANEEADSAATGDVVHQAWLVLGGAAALQLLGLDRDERCSCVALDRDDEDEAAVDRAAALLQQKRWTAVVFAAGCAEEAGDVAVLAQALHLVQAAVRDRGFKAPPFVLLTRGAQPPAWQGEGKGGKAYETPAAPTHAGLWGFARSVRMEYPDTLSLRCIDLDPLVASPGQSTVAALASAAAGALGEETAWSAEGAGAARGSRLVRSALRVEGPVRLNMPVRGALTNLRLVPQLGRRPEPPRHVQLRVRAVGLNFRDVLNVMGLYPGDPGPPGADVSGTVVALGEGVAHLRLADEIFGEAPGCLSTYHLAPAPLLTQKPPTWSFEAACAMPVIFVTVEESLGDLARLRRGERVLIHAAAGGVGLVAVQYAQYVGAEVFATAGAEEKRAFLRGLGVKYITSSRSGETFEREMKELLESAGGGGIDVVLNSLSHDDYIPRSLALLNKGGRFMEIGKRGTWTHERVREARPDVMYEKIAADTMMEREPWKYNSYLKRLLQRVEEGGLKPINLHIFDGLDRGVAAMQFLQRAQNIGKVVIVAPSRITCQPESTMVLSGGLGALGVVLAQFLVEEGCRSLCLTSRGGKPAGEVEAQWRWLSASSVAVAAERCDVSSEGSVQALAGAISGPLGGLWHLAGVLADGTLPALTRECFAKSYGPKVHGLYNLCNHLKLGADAPVVLFSSTSSLFGAPGQANYAASNSTLDAVAAHWAGLGRYRARAVQWGPWAEVGMAVQKGTVARAKATGLGSLTNAQGMTILGGVLAGGESLVGAALVRWPRFLRTVYAAGAPAFLADMAAEARKAATSSGVGGGGDVVDASVALAGLSTEERLIHVHEVIQRVAREVVDDQELSADAALLESGMDSLSGVEFRNRLLTEFGGVRIPNSAVFDYPTVTALAQFVNAQIGGGGGAVVASAASPAKREKVEDVAGEGDVRIFERLNERATGPQPLFLVPGAGMQSGGFRALAALLPLPVYGASWPRGLRQRADWPETLPALADLFLEEARALSPPGTPLLLAGHSFGASVCLEMARRAEAAGDAVALVVLLDPRNLPPVGRGLVAAFDGAGLVGTLALLSLLTADGAKYAELYEKVASLPEGQRDAALARALAPGALASLEHVVETSRWYAGLLDSAACEEAAIQKAPTTRLALLRAAETWLDEEAEGTAEVRPPSAANTVRDFQAAIFQSDSEVAERLPGTKPVRVPGDHFAMLHEPHVASLALRLCHALAEAGAAGAT